MIWKLLQRLYHCKYQWNGKRKQETYLKEIPQESLLGPMTNEI